MQIFGTVVSKTITSNGVFARIKVKGLPKNGFMRFFDVEDQDNFEIGKKVGILVMADPIDQAVRAAAVDLGVHSFSSEQAEQSALEHLGEGDYIDLHLNTDGVYMPPSNPYADIVGATGVDYTQKFTDEDVAAANKIIASAEEETGRL